MRSETYSQVVGLDFDHVKDLPALILAFRALSSTLAMFVSPGGEGLKVFVRVDCPAERHGEAYPLVAAFFEKAGGVASDAKCKDISRCCYVGDDGEAYYNSGRRGSSSTSPESSRPKRVSTRLSARFLDRIPPLAGARNQTVLPPRLRRGEPEGLFVHRNSRMLHAAPASGRLHGDRDRTGVTFCLSRKYERACDLWRSKRTN
ncbi:MAG: BT4734/BF3469 family protein [Parabacteroides merdae]